MSISDISELQVTKRKKRLAFVTWQCTVNKRINLLVVTLRSSVSLCSWSRYCDDNVADIKAHNILTTAWFSFKYKWLRIKTYVT